LTEEGVLPNVGTVGRKRINEEQMPARFKGGTLARIDAVRREKENRAEFVRVAIERELARRERTKGRKHQAAMR